MKIIIVLAALIAFACARPDGSAQTLRLEDERTADSYNFAYETSDSIKREEQGAVKQIGDETGAVISGKYSWTSPEGENFEVTFISDENGFQPQGSHLPK